MENECKKSFRFVVATRKCEMDRETLPIVRFVNRLNVSSQYEVSLTIEYENKRGLSSVYNEILSEEKSKTYENRNDFVIFVHDDIWIGDVFLFDKIISANEYFDLIGVCGGKGWESYGNGDTPIIWTHASRGKGLSGFMAHAADEKQSQIKHDITYDGMTVFSSNYGNSPSRTLTLDGCFMCFSKSAVESGLEFDERFRFHFYDMDVCFSAYVKNIMVGTAPVLLMHESLGYSVAQPQFIESQKVFLEKWFKKS